MYITYEHLSNLTNVQQQLRFFIYLNLFIVFTVQKYDLLFLTTDLRFEEIGMLTVNSKTAGLIRM